MHFSLALTALVAFGSQAYSQTVSGHYNILDAASDGSDALTAGTEVSDLGFAPIAGSPNQVWDFAPAGPNHVVIQSQDNGPYNGQYLNCPIAQPACILSLQPQLFAPSSEGGDLYSISDDTGIYQFSATFDKTLVLIDAVGKEPPVFTLSRA